MPIEQRVVAGGKIGGANKIGGSASSTATAGQDDDAPKSKKKKLLLLAVVAVVLLGGGAAAYLLLGKGPAEPEPEPAPVAGAVVEVEPVSLNLADGHYLRLGMALQLTEDVGEEAPDTARALDLAIALFSGRTIAEVSDPANREALTAELAHQLQETYEGEVMDVYLTNYVTQ
ncbi:flagellar basal body-associated FliL family protein [Cellulomonas fengjieae]|uniref:Flagellar protein FliL n=1 Tax=Cellulomonas fengjieae TaxID=2819978 RepID=A0ABS3SGQ2_9CELL|nr:flagellar basal body-associated FliL family protein [Cellulomonas fengjieae]MBO3084926.1 flagellar basal body-associated FliL family protein [Cellulomonas fengjieae]MBO3100673.1 flagellar basal body-associated FliL family protein [Cellulomonas fengjieae]QVI66472.1 flagellar basal body-associated FliL family protein [Cellulomonas fengjieae]